MRSDVSATTAGTESRITRSEVSATIDGTVSRTESRTTRSDVSATTRGWFANQPLGGFRDGRRDRFTNHTIRGFSHDRWHGVANRVANHPMDVCATTAGPRHEPCAPRLQRRRSGRCRGPCVLMLQRQPCRQCRGQCVPTSRKSRTARCRGSGVPMFRPPECEWFAMVAATDFLSVSPKAPAVRRSVTRVAIRSRSSSVISGGTSLISGGGGAGGCSRSPRSNASSASKSSAIFGIGAIGAMADGGSGCVTRCGGGFGGSCCFTTTGSGALATGGGAGATRRAVATTGAAAGATAALRRAPPREALRDGRRCRRLALEVLDPVFKIRIRRLRGRIL